MANRARDDNRLNHLAQVSWNRRREESDEPWKLSTIPKNWKVKTRRAKSKMKKEKEKENG